MTEDLGAPRPPLGKVLLVLDCPSIQRTVHGSDAAGVIIVTRIGRKGDPSVSEMELQPIDAEAGRCHFCGELFATQADLSEHLSDVHQNDDLGNMLT